MLSQRATERNATGTRATTGAATVWCGGHLRAVCLVRAIVAVDVWCFDGFCGWRCGVVDDGWSRRWVLLGVGGAGVGEALIWKAGGRRMIRQRRPDCFCSRFSAL